MFKLKFVLFVVTLAMLTGLVSPSDSQAAIQLQLTGDFRGANPDNIIVDVTIDISNGTYADWTVDLNSPLHPSAKLDAFYFNLGLGVGQSITFSNFSPNNAGKQWASVGGSNAAGSGSANFDYGVGLTGSGNPNANQVNNSTNLTFRTTLNTGSFTEAMFSGELSTGGGIPSPGAQMGAHVQSLVAGQGQSDSGFASGGGTVDPGPQVPEPAAIAVWLLLGCIGLTVASRKRSV